MVISFFRSATSMKPIVDALEDFRFERETEFAEAVPEGGSSGAGSEHYRVLFYPEVLGSHDLVCSPVFENAVLMNSRGMRKGVASNYRLVGLDGDVHDPAHHSARTVYLRGIDVCSRLVTFKPCPEHHYDFLEGCVSGPLADSIDRALHLVRSIADWRQYCWRPPVRGRYGNGRSEGRGPWMERSHGFCG